MDEKIDNNKAFRAVIVPPFFFWITSKKVTHEHNRQPLNRVSPWVTVVSVGTRKDRAKKLRIQRVRLCQMRGI